MISPDLFEDVGKIYEYVRNIYFIQDLIYISIYVEVIADIYCSLMYIGHLSKL